MGGSEIYVQNSNQKCREVYLTVVDLTLEYWKDAPPNVTNNFPNVVSIGSNNYDSTLEIYGVGETKPVGRKLLP